MRAELKDEVLAIISTPRRHAQLTALLTGAMIGTSLAKELESALESMMFDPDRVFAERSDATNAIRAGGFVGDWEVVIHRLLAIGDADSARLAFKILNDVGGHKVSIQTSVETVLAHLGLTVCQVPKSDERSVSLPRVRDSLFVELGTAGLGALLDSMADYARPCMRDADHSVKAHVADLIRELAARALERDATIAPERVWAWIGWLRGDEGYSDSAKTRLIEVFRRNRALRAGLLEYVLLKPCETNTRMAGYKLGDTNLGLYPTNEDLVGVLRALRVRAADGVMNADMWRDVVRLGRSRDGIVDIVRDAATETAQGDLQLLADLAEMAEVVVPKWELEQAKREARAEAKRQAAYQSYRDIHTKRAHDVAAGNFHILDVAADVYLGRHSEFDLSAPSEVRLQAFLGDALAEQALTGFIAVLSRDDLPSAAEIAEIRGKSEQWVAEEPMICGVSEMVRRGQPIDMINRATLAAVLMAWQRAPESGSQPQIDIGPPLESVLFSCERDTEAYFRTSIEPQLACRKLHPEELYRLTHEAQWAALAGRLTADWLRAYPALAAYTQNELMTCALENASPAALTTLVVDSRATVHPDYETMLLWLSADYVVDFDNSRATLMDAATNDPDFFWLIRDRLGSERRDVYPRFTVAQLSFVVEVFATHWPRVERPASVTSGDTNPWDASEFIQRVIYAIANRPSAEATESLKSLIKGPALSYADAARHALTLQRKARRDHEYVAPTVSQLQAVMTKALPETIDDMRASFADRIEAVQERMQGSNTDMWEAYWDGARPKAENYCRNRLVEHISGQLPSSIRFEPEMHMPGQKRADIAAIRNSIGLPVEIKGQWHANMWTAPVDQLDAQYTRDWHAEGRGAYIVIWFGNVPGKRRPKHPQGLDRPKTPETLRQMLIDLIPEARRSHLDVFVMDVSRPANIT